MNEAENIQNSEQLADQPANGAPEAAPGTPEQPTDQAAAGDVKGAQDTASDETAEAPDQPSELELAYGEVADLKDKLLRAMAETENVRRRSERDKADSRKYAVADFARDMLAVSDNLQRALGAVSGEARGDNPELAQLLEGVELTRKEMLGYFEKHGIREVDPMGEKLDPNLHQAVVQLDDPNAAHGTIVQVMQPGYVIHDRLLRAAMVGVAKGAPAPEAAPAAEPAQSDAMGNETAEANEATATEGSPDDHSVDTQA